MFFPVVGSFVPVAWIVVFLLVAGELVAGVGEAEVFVFLVWGSFFSVVFSPPPSPCPRCLSSFLG